MKKTLPLSDIIRAKEFQLRPIDKEYVQDLWKAYEGDDKASIPPPRVWKIKGRQGYFLTRGFHRCAGADKAGMKRIEVEEKSGTAEEAFADALSGDLNNGKRFTNRDKHRAVKKAIKQFPQWSARKIADLLGVSNAFVSGVLTVNTAERKAMESKLKSAELQRQLVKLAGEKIAYPVADKWVESVTELAKQVLQAMVEEKNPPKEPEARLF